MAKDDFKERLKFSSASKKTTTKGVTDLLLGIGFDDSDKELKITMLPIDKLIHFRNHPFRLYSMERLLELAESIEQNGVLMPIIVRPLHNDSEQYEILAGHNRTEASKLAGKKTIPSRIIDCNDDEAILIVTETNLKQREKLLHSEKAKAYEMQMEALKSQGKRTDLKKASTLYPMETKLNADNKNNGTLYPMDTKLDAGKEIAIINNESRASIFRYIRLNKLTEGLLTLVDNEVLPFRAGVELSYLKQSEQCALEEIIGERSSLVPTIEMAKELRKESKEMLLSKVIIEAILNPPKADKKNETIKPSYKMAFKSVEKQIKKLPEEEVRKLSEVNEDILQEIIISALKAYIESLL